jgi:hypothetical protein
MEQKHWSSLVQDIVNKMGLIWLRIGTSVRN